MTTTAAERRAAAKVEYDAYLAGCPSRQLLSLVTDKWVTLVLCALGSAPTDDGGARGALRFSELSRRLAGVSQKMLTQTLRGLERDGLVTRSVVATVPVTVSYALTDLGASLQVAVRGLKEWAEAHMDEVLAARAVHDGTA